MDLSFLGGGGGRRGGGLDVFEQLRLRGELLRNLREHIVRFADPGEARELRHLGDHLLIIDRVERILLRQLRGHQAQEITLVRSEEHTSELQSLMRISYAVFCLKKKKIKTTKD